jgi:monoterpene epsilon-lactone hydrolase
MPSPAHEEMVRRLKDVGMATPVDPPTTRQFAAIREAEVDVQVPTPDGVMVGEVDAGGVPAIWVAPETDRSELTLLYLHGGGYIWMTPWTHLPAIAGLAKAVHARCLAPHYRRAPEHPYPAAVEDAVSVYRWLIKTGNSPSQIVLAGDSAGGGLVLAALVALRDLGAPLPAAALCFSPWADLTVSGESALTTEDPIVTGASLRMMASLYLHGANPKLPTASPLFADLTGLPPLQIQVGTRESLLSDARAVAARAQEFGVECELIEHEGVIHMWIVFGAGLPESREAFTRAARHRRGIDLTPAGSTRGAARVAGATGQGPQHAGIVDSSTMLIST